MKNFNESAFPNSQTNNIKFGMTKLEYASIMAMQGLCANGYNPNGQMRQLDSKSIANKSIAIAKELLTQLENEKQ